MTIKIALIGAESTGKSRLALELAERLRQDTGLRCAVVPEHLRSWCETRGRTPRADEQAAIAAEQARQIEEAAAQGHELVICDTTPLMTAIYSQLLFRDPSLLPAALDFQRRCELTLLTALDLPWVADGLQRDGPQVQQPVDAALRSALLGAGLGWSGVGGREGARLESALNAVTPLLLRRGRGQRSGGLFTRLQARQEALPEQAWFCQDCDVPECEHASLRLRTQRDA
ncbi:ATP-binding protein [Roseateles sp. DAIF2]|uniref:AAA family ATPase n=1 Tax=Roseateles sp. DAIF2 TaxID=2714952 RepID=UPI0018A2ABA8|nr:ATP-binding protein [Roseateles sp. DAIF2]QPF74330.1 ATP-binding protein [Roseateles sp. DAIF2]